MHRCDNLFHYECVELGDDTAGLQGGGTLPIWVGPVGEMPSGKHEAPFGNVQ